MNLLNDNGKIDLTIVDTRDYSGFKGEFIEDLDPHLAKLVLDDESTFKVPQEEYVEIDGVWETQQKKDENGELLWVKAKNGDGSDAPFDVELPRFTPESKTLLKKRLRLLRNGNQLKILYHQKKGNLGRFYSNEDNSLTCLARNIRNTIYHFQSWVDYDFVASHPTILSQLAVKLRIPTPRLDEWVKDKKPIVKMLSDHHSVEGEPPLQKDHIKKLVCSALYGGGLETWACGEKQPNGTRKGGIINGKPEKNEMPMKCRNYEDWTKGHKWYKELKQEVKKISQKLIRANPEIKERVMRPDDPDWKKDNSTISYILGIFENECLYQAYQYGINNELITARRANLAYDGFTTPPPPPYTDHAFHLNAVNEFIFENTGFKMKMEVKAFEEWTIQYDLIETRRAMVIADAVDAPDVAIVAEGDIAIAEEQSSNTDQAYLIWKERFERDHTKIINTANYFKRITERLPNGDEKFDGYKIFNKTDLINAYEHESYMKVNPETGKRKKTKFINEWIADATIQRKDDSKILPPPLYCPPNVLNLWKPSDYYGQDILETDERYDKKAVDMWLNHIKVMCDYDEPAYEYSINWFAHLLQRPAEKSSHLIITGKQGTGKTIALTPIKKIMGGGYFETSQPERDVWGNFNPLMASSLLVVLSECDKRNSFGSENKIKALITDPEMTINDKGIKPFVIQSFHRFITPTNSYDPVKLEEEERRNMIIKMSDEFKKNWEYFKTFADTWDNDAACLSLYSYLMRRDIREWNRWVIPHTEYHKQLAEFNRNPLDEFFEWFVARAWTNKWVCDDEGYFTRYGSEVMTEFRVWRDELGGKYDVNGTGDLIKKLTCSLNLPKGCIGKGTRTNKGARTMFNLENLRKHYQIGVCMIDLSSQAAGGNGSGSDSDVEEEMICNIGEDTTTEEDENEDKIADAAATTEEVLDDTNSVEVRCGNGKVIRVKKQKKNW
jgi:hypothetical protein